MTYRNILLPTDGSDCAQRAIRSGIALARALGASVTGFHAAPAATPIALRGMLPRLVDLGPRTQLIERQTHAQLQRIEKAARAAGVPCRVFSTVSDYPADAILAAAKRHRCDLIFMATHGRQSRRGPLLGSVSARVTASSAIPFLLHR